MRSAIGTLLVTAALASCAAPATAQTGQPIGSTIVVVRQVTAELDKEARTLQTGDNVRQDELIQVSTDGRSELKLHDETKLALGPGSRLLLDKFVYDSQRSSGSIVMNMVKGTFRFVTGVASKPSYTVRVPNASITVRGTIFDLNVLDSGEVWALLLEGAFRACIDGGGQCRTVDTPGRMIRIVNGRISEPMRWTAMPGRRTASFDRAFPFVAQAPQIDPVPIYTREAILLGQIIRPRRPDRPPITQPPTRTGSQPDRIKPTQIKPTRVVKPPVRIIKKSTTIRRAPMPKRVFVPNLRRR